MKQARLKSAKEFVVEQGEMPVLNADSVWVEVKATGICGSDIHAYYGEHPFIPLPIVLGHEFSGIVTEAGSEPHAHWVGQKVVIDPTLTCGECRNCKRGRANICEGLKLIGCQRNGAYAEYVSVPVTNLLEMPDSMSFIEGAFVEPLAVGVHACHRGQVTPGTSVCVVGAGTIGLTTAIAARKLGASQVVLVDVSEDKCRNAVQFGFEAKCNRNLAVKELMLDAFGPDGPDILFECVGIEPTIRFCIEGAPKGGKIVVVGVFGRDTSVPMALVQDRELELIGTLTYSRRDFQEAMAWIAEHDVDVQQFITKTFPLSDVAEAFRFIETHRATVLKVTLDPSIEEDDADAAGI